MTQLANSPEVLKAPNAEEILPLLWNEQDAGGTRNINGEREGKVTLRVHPVNSQGYDAEGKYWGIGSKSVGRVYIAEAGPTYRRFTWAHSRAGAASNLKLESKDLTKSL